ncbi:MAG: winged helix-turn-helix domain-containing protein [Muribaculaceae bacterium]|nr:winged helix-turn-helix domain-containing protein [Muribaculaceae bacterium]MBR5743876.1 winged helix-turn-helix domain-containing protein [Muribaculaceae bacterium]
MNAENIGTFAGLVWNALNETNPSSTKDVKKATKLKDKELYAAIGWLAREDKLGIEATEDGKDLVLTLK